MNQSEMILQNTLPDDIDLNIASFLQVLELCSLGSCSKFWRELCSTDYLWVSLSKDRCPALGISSESPIPLILNNSNTGSSSLSSNENIQNVLVNLAGLHYCMFWLNVSTEDAIAALRNCSIQERELCVSWWKLGRWFYGFHMRDESNIRRVSLGDLALAKENEVLAVLCRGAIHEVLRVQISIPPPACITSLHAQ
ncbi:uncharacterized protein LOC113350198 isoform X2 [Papaver somniferum]|uniref:uncharacterized protein LOC113350198 isoform X2 n=1 Tax=Papaver somniferum TaxID=3469 RepID=UPI000E700821|nr:uncharacterized protein LOC113350198 isoform X2 [Papaver somniferum]